MKKVFFVLIFLIPFYLPAVTYYVAANGNDNNNGLSSTSPWKTIAKVNSKMSSLKAGDKVLFRRGDTFIGTLNIRISGLAGNPITFGAYDTGELPIIAGYQSLSNWTSVSGYSNVWQASFSSSQSNIASLFVGETLYPLGRYPNLNSSDGGYLIYESHTSKSQIKDNEMPTAINWTGAEAVIRGTRWVLDRTKILSHSVSQKAFDIDAATITINLRDKYGYFVQNHIKTLDKNYEWAFDSATKKVYLYSSADPNTLNVKISNVQNLITAVGVKYITVENFALKMSNSSAIDISGGSYIKISNCEINFAGNNGIELGESAKYCTIENNKINYANTMGVYITNSNNKIIGNTLKNIGIHQGLGQTGVGGKSSTGIFASGDNNLIQYNDIDGTGYNGIAFYGDNVIVQNNFVKNACLTKNDGGGIYTHSPSEPGFTGSKILNNIVLSSYGYPLGTESPTLFVTAGLYMDGLTANIEIRGNTIAYANHRGIFLHNSINMNIQDNVLFGNEVQLAYVSDNSAPLRIIKNNTVKNNLLVKMDKLQAIVDYNLRKDDIISVGALDYNNYINPISGDTKSFNYYYDKVTSTTTTRMRESLTLSQIQSRYRLDLNSKMQPITYSSTVKLTDYVRFEYNASSAPIVVPLGGSYIDKNGVALGSSITIPAYGSVVIFKTSSVVKSVLNTNVWLEAECPSTLGSSWEVKTDNLASNTSYLAPKAGLNSTSTPPTSTNAIISYNFSVNESKNYDFWARTLATNSSDDSFWVKIDNQSWTEWDLTTQSSYVWQKIALSAQNLTSGSHTLSFAYREDGARMDKIFITDAGSNAPTSFGETAANCNTASTLLAKASNTQANLLSKTEDDEAYELAEDLVIYPNPVQDLTTIAYNTGINSDEKQSSEIFLFDLFGNQIKSWTQIGSKGSLQIDLTNLPAGTYIVRLSSGKVRYQKKLLRL